MAATTSLGIRHDTGSGVVTILVTGGAGFVGACFVSEWLAERDESVVNLDALTYAGDRSALDAVKDDPRHVFVHADVADTETVGAVLSRYAPRAIVHFAAETHVDRSISDPGAFVRTNVAGTVALLEIVTRYWTSSHDADPCFRFVHVSTDEVYGSLGLAEPPVTERSPFAPNNPYAASKAAADHFVRVWHRTWGLPALSTHCSNNYGPRQFPEKLIPRVLQRARALEPVPVYGDGSNVREWLHVSDHCRALMRVVDMGVPGRSYNIGGGTPRSNLELANELCAALDALAPRADGRPFADLLQFVRDRPGHDMRYAVDATRISNELGWAPTVPFADGLAQTVRWYLEHPEWLDR